VFHAKHGPVAVWVGYSGGDPVLLQPEQMILPSPYTIDYGVVRIIFFLSKGYRPGISQVPVLHPTLIHRYRFAIHKILDCPITKSPFLDLCRIGRCLNVVPQPRTRLGIWYPGGDLFSLLLK